MQPNPLRTWSVLSGTHEGVPCRYRSKTFSLLSFIFLAAGRTPHPPVLIALHAPYAVSGLTENTLPVLRWRR
eukprot:231607-Rhodomonas_salina.2